MRKLILVLSLLGIVASGLLSVEVFADDDNKLSKHGKQQIRAILNMLAEHDTRITGLEDKTSVSVTQGGTTPSLLARADSLALTAVGCPILTLPAGGDEPEMVQGWCPDGAHKLYMITDPRVIDTSLVIINVADGGVESSECEVIKSGTISVNEGDYPNSFVIRCTATAESMALKYSVFN